MIQDWAMDWKDNAELDIMVECYNNLKSKSESTDISRFETDQL
jgi:hypothetical protein